MTRQNRILPTGEIVADPFRGSLMGNRGVLHDDTGRIRRPWQLRRWITCVLSFRDRHRTVMAPGRYTELFFWDEASSFAAGHRPCAECRRADYERFRDAWVVAFGGRRPSAEDMDGALHEARLDGRCQRVFEARLGDLPPGVFVCVPADEVCLWLGDRLRTGACGQYGAPHERDPAEIVTVLTPRPLLAVFSSGYRPAIRLP